MDRAGFEPAASALRRLYNREKRVDWASFRKFLEKSCSGQTVGDRLRYARKYCSCLLNRDFSELNTFSDCKRNHVLKALSNLAKFLGIYQELKELMKRHGLTWKTTSSEDLIISRLNNSRENGNVINWITKVKEELPELDVFLDFFMMTGLRFNESVEAYNLVIDLAREDRLNKYYNAEMGVLEHFRFKEHFVRRTKKVFISFIPKRFIEELCKQENLTEYQIANRIKRAGFQSRFSDVREYFATFMTKHLSQPEIDFLQGRVSANVFMRNYFNPALLGDLKERMAKAIAELQSKEPLSFFHYSFRILGEKGRNYGSTPGSR